MPGLVVRWRHPACAGCYWLGQFNQYDLWWCVANEEELIARHGNTSADYIAAPLELVAKGAKRGNGREELLEALRRRNNHRWALDRLAEDDTQGEKHENATDQRARQER